MLLDEFCGIDAQIMPSRIACLMLAEMGDLLVITPSIHAIKERYPGAKLTLVIRSHLASLVWNNPYIDETIELDARSSIGKIRFLLKLFIQKFDLFFDLHTPTFNTCTTNSDVFKRNAKVMRFVRSKFKVGYAMPETNSHLTHSIKVPDAAILGSENIVDTTLRIVGETGNRNYKKKIWVDSADTRWALSWLRDNCLDNKQILVCFFGSKQPADIWPKDHVIRFIHACLNKYPLLIILHIGGKLEIELGRYITSKLDVKLKERFYDLSGRTKLGETTALVEQSSYVVSTDSGPLHIADCLLKPTVAIFSSKNYPEIWAPLSDKSCVVNCSVDCGPCFQSVCNRNDHMCMSNITVDEVLQKLQVIMDA